MRRRIKIGAAICAVAAITSVAPLIGATAASANTRSDWSAVYDGVEFGWTTNHAWVIASYATILTIGASEVGNIVCDEVGLGSVCSYVVGKVVSSLVAGEPRVTNHGIWAAFYPATLKVTDGRY